jgi:glycosyltransferase involved in cell wall biosynthesis
VYKYENLKSRILILTDWYEPGYKAGGPIQSVKNIVTRFSDQYDFYILTSDRDLGELTPYKGLPTDKWVQNDSKENIWYASPGAMNRKNLESIFRQVQPDIVYFNSMFSSRFTIVPLWILIRSRFQGRLIIAPRGMLHAGALKRKTLKKKIFLKVFKLLGWSRRLQFHATDRQEYEDIIHYFSKDSRIIIAENIPNLNRGKWTSRAKAPGALNSVFISRINRKKNLHYILEIFKELKRTGKISLDIYGETDDPAYAQKCERIAKELPSNISVNFKGPVSHHEVFETLEQYHLFVLPTLGENFGHAIFEAMSSGCPVLISDQTPWQQLTVSKGGFGIPLNDRGSYLSALENFVQMDQQEFDKWSFGAKCFADKFYVNSDFENKYRELFG